jgi:Methyltransferase domain
MRSSGLRSAKRLARRCARPLLRVGHFGTRFHCSVCGSHLRQMLPAGRVPRPNAACPVCGSLERHRLDWLFLRHHTDLFDGRPKRLLHFAPEPCLESRLRAVPNAAYVSTDLSRPRALIRADIRRLPYADGAFDVIYCSHVLEHVEEDRLAMRELRRILAPRGFALLQVPITAERTLEDDRVKTPEERARVFGHPGHVRHYGLDYVGRLEGEGFRVRATSATEVADAEALPRLGIDPRDRIFLCRRSET